MKKNLKFKSRSNVEEVGKKNVNTRFDNGLQFTKMLNLFEICADPDDYGFAPHVEDGYWESWITYWMDKNVEPGSFVADIGANHGYYSLFLAGRGCMVHAYEPQEKLCDLIEKSVGANKFDENIKVFSEAISKEAGWAEFTVPVHHGMNATLTTPGYMPDGFEKIKVVTSTLDNNPWDYDFIKIDAEGAEYLIWDGMQKWLERNKDVTILMEWRYDRYPNAESFAEDIFSKMSITCVNFDGEEEDMDLDKLYTKKNEDWMLVLRSKDTNTP
jgi:FkbM family methyltransferase